MIKRRNGRGSRLGGKGGGSVLKDCGGKESEDGEERREKGKER